MAQYSLEEQLLPEPHAEQGLQENVPVDHHGMSSSTKKKIILSVAAFLAVAAVVGVVAGTQANRSRSSSAAVASSGSSASGADFAVLSHTVSFQARPQFTKAVGPLASAPSPSVYAQTKETTSARMTFRHNVVSSATGRVAHTRLVYDVEKNNNAHCLSNYENVAGIYCKAPTTLGLLFPNHTDAQAHASQWGPGTVLFLRGEWRCGEHVRQLVSAPVVLGRKVFMTTVNVTIAHAFKHASIDFFTNHTHGGPDSSIAMGPYHKQAALQAGPAHHQRRSFLSYLGNLVGGAVSGLIQAAVTGQLSVDDPYTSTYSVSPSTLSFSQANDGASVDGSLTYSADLTINTDVNLQIQSYSITSFSASVSASASASVAASFQASAGYSSSNQGQLTQDTIASGVIDVFGIPVPISLVLTTFGGYNANFAGNTAVSGSFLSQVRALFPSYSSSPSSSTHTYIHIIAYAPLNAIFRPPIFRQADVYGEGMDNFTIK